MATETADKRGRHLRGVTVTGIASLAGIAAGLVTPVIDPSGTSVLGLAAVFAGIVFGMGVMYLFGIDVTNFSKKDHLFVTFMVFALWFITLTIILTSGVTF